MPTGGFEVAKVRAALADRYRIQRVLGEGGMATVYLAEDLKHKREVAVKVMRPELAETLGAERFVREVEIAAKLSHPHILPVYDSGAANGVFYYVMPVIEGESLPARLRRERQLPVEEAVRLAREVAEALAYAHARGFVHRDIKPANILLSAGHALVADFGIARAMDQGAGTGITQTGLAIGTPQYMSPEQASGATDLDGRSDIYALGCVLYEMLAGEPPFTGPTAQAVIMRSLTEAPRPLEQTRTQLPPAIGAVVTRALAKAPADRFPDAGAMAKALAVAEREGPSGEVMAPSSAASRQRIRPWHVAVTAAALVGAGVLGSRLMGSGGRTAAEAAVAKRVVVLPFQHLGPAEDAYLADGIVEELRGKLAKVGGLTIIASTSADQYRGTSLSGPEIAKELRVDQVLTGKVQWAEAGGTRRVRVSAELVDGQSGAITWRETFDAELTDVFTLQSQLATRVAGALGAVLGQAATAELAARPTQNAAAYDLYLKGEGIKNSNPAALRQAAGYFSQAVELDSTFAEAWGRLAVTQISLYANGTRDPEALAAAKQALSRALALGTDNVTVQRAAATTYLALGDQPARIRALTKALELDPNNANVLAALASVDAARGDYPTALAKLSQARDRDPRSRAVLQRLIETLVYLRRAREALPFADELLALEPTNVDALHQATRVHLAAGDLEGARRVVRDGMTRIAPTEVLAQLAGIQEISFLLDPKDRNLVFRLTPAAFDDDRAWWGQSLATAAYQQGDRARARAYADSALAESKRQADAAPDDPQLRALYAVMLAYTGQHDAAQREVNRAVANAPVERKDENALYTRTQEMRVLLAAGRTDEALDALEEVLRLPSYFTPAYLGTDPLFAPLKGNPRFERLKAGGIATPTN